MKDGWTVADSQLEDYVQSHWSETRLAVSGRRMHHQATLQVSTLNLLNRTHWSETRLAVSGPRMHLQETLLGFLL
jgi:hypothetical protein